MKNLLKKALPLKENHIDLPYVSLKYNSDSAPSLFTFAARSQAPGTFSFYKSSLEETLNRYMFNCENNSWYLNGINGFSSNYEETVENFKALIKRSSNSNSLFIGSSMGGYAAALFGAQCNARRIITFGAELLINLPTSYSSENLADIKQDSPFFRLDPFISRSTSLFDIFAGEFCPVDIFSAALTCRYANCRLHLLKDTRHMAVTTIKDAGLLQSVVNAGLENRPINLPRSFYADDAISDFINNYPFQFDLSGYKQFLSDYTMFYVTKNPNIQRHDFLEVLSFLYKAKMFSEAFTILNKCLEKFGVHDSTTFLHIQLLYRTRRYKEVLSFPNADHLGTTLYFKAASAARMDDLKTASYYLAEGYKTAEKDKNLPLQKSLTDLQKNLNIP